jgi:PhnB protein
MLLKMVKPILEGYHSITAHLVVNNATDAIEFYKHAFGAVEDYRYNGPDNKSILYVKLIIGDSPILLSDEFPNTEGIGCRSPKSIGGSAVTIHLFTENVDKIFNQAISAGATTIFPITDMFWGDRYGQLVDPFGHFWSMATHNDTKIWRYKVNCERKAWKKT